MSIKFSIQYQIKPGSPPGETSPIQCQHFACRNSAPVTDCVHDSRVVPEHDLNSTMPAGEKTTLNN